VSRADSQYGLQYLLPAADGQLQFSWAHFSGVFMALLLFDLKFDLDSWTPGNVLLPGNP